VQLADVARLDDFAYYLVYPPHHAERNKVAAFRGWILDAARADDAASMSGTT
jgi:LysR family glycine cleavage system transcriptional activator